MLVLTDRCRKGNGKRGENKRTYLSINCYIGSGRFKGSYQCGYVDEVTGKYVCNKYDDVGALTKKYIGRLLSRPRGYVGRKEQR